MKTNGQASIELTLAMIVLIMMVFAVLKVGSWGGLNMLDVQKAHEETFYSGQTGSGELGHSTYQEGPLGQTDPYFYRPRKIGAAWLDE